MISYRDHIELTYSVAEHTREMQALAKEVELVREARAAQAEAMSSRVRPVRIARRSLGFVLIAAGEALAR